MKTTAAMHPAIGADTVGADMGAGVPGIGGANEQITSDFASALRNAARQNAGPQQIVRCATRLSSCWTMHIAKAGLFGLASLVALSSRSSVQELVDFLQTCIKSPAQYDPAVGVDEHVTAAVVGVRQMLPLS